MQRALTLFLAILSFCLMMVGLVAAQEADPADIPFCTDTAGEYYQPDVFPRYEYQNDRFLLVNYNTGEEVRVLAENFPTDSFFIVSWSPGCRYLTAAVDAQRDYYVWDMADGHLVGQVERGRRIHWRPNLAQALVETPNGAVIWHMADNRQILLDTPYDEWDGRNFSRFYFDNANNWLVTTHIDGVRYVYAIDTGDDVTQAYQIVAVENNAAITDAGTVMDCHEYSTYQLGYRQWEYGSLLDVEYRADLQQLVLVSTNGQIVKILESDIVLQDEVHTLTWTSTCRYLFVAFGTEAQSDTVVYDIVNGGRVGEFPDARGHYHYINPAPTSDHVIIHTRNGGYLWDVVTDTKTLLTNASDGRGVNLYRIEWETETNTILTVPVGAANGVMVYDYSGNEVGFYGIDTHRTPVYYRSYPSQNQIIVYSQASLTAFDRTTGEGEDLSVTWDVENPHLSPDGRYLLTVDLIWVGEGRYNGQYQNIMRVWDLENLGDDPTHPPTYRHVISRSENWRHYSSGSITADYHYVSGIRTWDIFTGARLDLETESAFDVATVVPTSTSGESPQMGHIRRQKTCPYIYATDYRAELRYETDYDYGSRTSSVTVYEGEMPVFTDGYAGAYSRESVAYGWTYDCRYIILNPAYAVDLSTLTLVTPPSYPTVRAVSPNRDYVLLRSYTYNPTYVHNILYRYSDGNEVELCAPDRYSTCATLTDNLYWDFEHNQVISLKYRYRGTGQYLIFDLNTGALRAEIYTTSGLGGHSDGALMTSDSQHVAVQHYNTMTLWNIETLDSYEVIMRGQFYYAVDYSPNHSFLVALQMWGIDVWDLRTFGDNIDERRVNFTIPIYGDFRFLDDTTLEITVGEVVTVIDLNTGEVVE